MAVLSFRRAQIDEAAAPDLSAVIRGYSIEVMPRTLAKVANLSERMPRGTEAFIAHIDGTAIADMVAAAERLQAEGFEPVPHIPARSVPSRDALAEWVSCYQDVAGVRRFLLLAGGAPQVAGTLESSMDLAETGLFAGAERLYFAGHPEGNRDIDATGTAGVDDALRWKHDFARSEGIDAALVTQFAFDATPVVDWANRIADDGIDLPIRVGLAGPAKLQTLIKYAIACGVGPSIRVLKRRAADVTKLMTPYTPDDVARALAVARVENFAGMHLFPLGGISAALDWASAQDNAQTQA